MPIVYTTKEKLEETKKKLEILGVWLSKLYPKKKCCCVPRINLGNESDLGDIL